MDNKPIAEDEVLECMSLYKKYYDMQNSVTKTMERFNKRGDYIKDVINRAIMDEHPWYSPTHAEEVESFYMEHNNFSLINYYFHGWRNEDDFTIIDRDGKLLHLSDGFPRRWYFENFEKELENGFKEYRANRTKIQKYELDKEAREKALSKLTVEERNLLGL